MKWTQVDGKLSRERRFNCQTISTENPSTNHPSMTMISCLLEVFCYIFFRSFFHLFLSLAIFYFIQRFCGPNITWETTEKITGTLPNTDFTLVAAAIAVPIEFAFEMEHFITFHQ